MITKIQEIANATQYTSNKADFVTNLYWNLVGAGLKPCVINERYIELDGATYQLINRRKVCRYEVQSI